MTSAPRTCGNGEPHRDEEEDPSAQQEQNELERGLGSEGCIEAKTGGKKCEVPVQSDQRESRNYGEPPTSVTGKVGGHAKGSPKNVGKGKHHRHDNDHDDAYHDENVRKYGKLRLAVVDVSSDPDESKSGDDDGQGCQEKGQEA
jgi:hypothetical protein